MKLTELAKDPIDTITIDVPLFIRMLEWAREDAKSDIELHQAAENAVRLSKDGCGALRTRDYPQLIQIKSEQPKQEIAAENGQSPAGEYIAPNGLRFTHGEKYPIVNGPMKGHHVRVVARNFLKRQPDGTMTQPTDSEVAVQLPNGGVGYIQLSTLDRQAAGNTDFTEPVRPGFPY